jgi:hypothetical protein
LTINEFKDHARIIIGMRASITTDLGLGARPNSGSKKRPMSSESASSYDCSSDRNNVAMQTEPPHMGNGTKIARTDLGMAALAVPSANVVSDISQCSSMNQPYQAPISSYYLKGQLTLPKLSQFVGCLRSVPNPRHSCFWRQQCSEAVQWNLMAPCAALGINFETASDADIMDAIHEAFPQLLSNEEGLIDGTALCQIEAVTANLVLDGRYGPISLWFSQICRVIDRQRITFCPASASSLLRAAVESLIDEDDDDLPAVARRWLHGKLLEFPEDIYESPKVFMEKALSVVWREYCRNSDAGKCVGLSHPEAADANTHCSDTNNHFPKKGQKHTQKHLRACDTPSVAGDLHVRQKWIIKKTQTCEPYLLINHFRCNVPL